MLVSFLMFFYCWLVCLFACLFVCLFVCSSALSLFSSFLLPNNRWFVWKIESSAEVTFQSV